MSKNKMSSYKVMVSVFDPFINPTEEEIQTISGFFFCRYLGLRRDTIFLGNLYNTYYKEIPIKVQYSIAKGLYSGKSKQIQMPKFQLTNLTKSVMEFYKVNTQEALEYIKLMNQDIKNHFENLYPKEYLDKKYKS